MKDFTNLKRMLRTKMDTGKAVQEIDGYLISKSETGYIVTVTVGGDEMYVCTL